MPACIDLDRDPRLGEPPLRYVTKISVAMPDTELQCSQYFFLTEDAIAELVALADLMERRA